jgi:hypothetical protein
MNDSPAAKLEGHQSLSRSPYHAFTDPAALILWLPPAQMTGEI